MSALPRLYLSRIFSKQPGYFQNFQPLIHTNLLYQSNRHVASKTTEPTSSPLPHHYTTLNIDENASIDAIKKSYNILIKQWHPDLYVSKPVTQQQEAQTKFMLIREAYETLITHKENISNPEISERIAQKQHNKFKAAKRTAANARYSYYSWGKKVFETQTQSESDIESEECEEEEIKYSESYKQNKTWIGKAMEEMWDWLIFVYMRNPSWMQFFIISSFCFVMAQCVWHILYPNIDDSDPDRMWNVYKHRNNKEKGMGTVYQPSSTASMTFTPSLVALQPHFKGHTLYGKEANEDNKYKGSEDDFSDLKKDSTWKMFTTLNMNSTVNKDAQTRKKKRKRGKVAVVDNNSEIAIENAKKEQETKEMKRSVLDYNDIPLELRASPMGVLLASTAAKSGDLPKENGKYDWSSVIDNYRQLNEQNDTELLQTQ